MSENKTKYLVAGVVIIFLVSLFFIGVSLFKSDFKGEKENTISQKKEKSMLSYTLDGEKTDIKPTKDKGYIANKIICENGSNLVWDNTNWEVEIIDLESNDVCSVDFTVDTSNEGYRVNVITNVERGIDSFSKATIENGTVVFYANKGYEIIGVSGCNGRLDNNKVLVKVESSNQTCNINVKEPLKTLYAILSDGSKYTVGTRNTAATTPIEGTSITQGYNSTGKIYKTGNDYYFAGNPSDNWVKFADKWWRIIRSNSSEGTRLLYAGTSHDGQDGYINNTTYVWSSSYNDSKYVQWSYTSSTIGNALATWYNANIIGTNANMVNTSVAYCNDTSVSSTSGSTQYFGAYGRLVDAKNPSHSCGTNSNSTNRSIGLMTADEVAFAGGVYGAKAPNTYYYRNSKSSGCTGSSGDVCNVTKNNAWWTMSPNNFSGASVDVFDVNGARSLFDSWAKMFVVLGAANPAALDYYTVNGSGAVRPVITLKPEVLISGSGTTSNPYVPSLN